MDILLDILTWACFAGGAAMILIASIGMLRLPDMYTRMHAAGITDTLGLLLIMGGLILQAGFTLVSFKLFLIVALVYYTSPVSTHALARAALDGGLKPLLAKDEEASKS